MKLLNNKFFEKIINILLNILIFIFGIVLLIPVYTGFQTRILGNEYSDFFGYSLFEVQTGSMADTINAGDWIIVKLTKNVKLHDIITYKLDKEFITHKIVEVYSGTYVTMGDANNTKDKPIDQSQIVGKVVKILPNFGIFRKTLFNPSVLISLVITLFLFNLAVNKNKKKSSITKTERKIKKIIDIIIEKFKVFLNNLKKLKNNENIVAFINKINLIINKIKRKKISEESNDNQVTDEETKALENYKKLYDLSEFENEEYEEDELEKTSVFRVIPVDASEIENTFFEIAKNEIKEDKNSKEEKALKDKKTEEEIDKIKEEGLTKIDLQLLKNRKKKRSKNIVDSVINIKEEELNELIKILTGVDKTVGTETTIKDIFINTYTDAKYYNYYGDKDIEYNGKNLTIKVEKTIEEVSRELIKTYKGNEKTYSELVDKYTNIFIIIANLEKAKESITDMKGKKEFYKKQILKYFKTWNNQKVQRTNEEIIKIQKNYDVILDYFLKKLETNMFNLKLNKLITKKNIYGAELEHNISFSKVYSDYIIDKTYTEGIVAEDKMSVLLTLLLVQLTKDMISANFNKKYIIYLPQTLYSKEKKCERLLRMFDDEYAKNNIIILLTFADLLNNKQSIKKFRKNGYKFALLIDSKTELKQKNRSNINIADYIFVNKKDVNITNIHAFIPEELLDNIIYEDIAEKVCDFGGEQE